MWPLYEFSACMHSALQGCYKWSSHAAGYDAPVTGRTAEERLDLRCDRHVLTYIAECPHTHDGILA